MISEMDSRILGEKNNGNVSSSDDEPEEEKPVLAQPTLPSGPQTGPKGVLADYKRYSEFKKLEKIKEDLQTIEEIKKKSFTADPDKHPEKEEEEFDDDDFLQKYHEKRLLQMKNLEQLKATTKYGYLFTLTKDELSRDIEKPDSHSILLVHLFDPSVKACIQMNKCLECLAQQYPYVKFAKVMASEVGMSLNFKMNALPTLQVYKSGKLIGNFLKITEKLDSEFYASDVENFLIDSDMLTGFQNHCEDMLNDSDYELD